MEKSKSTLETSGKDENYTGNEWKSLNLHSKRVEKMKNSLETSEVRTPLAPLFHRTVFLKTTINDEPIFPTRNECSFTSSPLETSLV